MARAATETQKAGLTGLEFGLAIPGTVGGAVWANAGAHESDVAGVLESADVLLADGTRGPPAAAELDLGYRDSRFKHAPGRDRPRRDVPPRAGRLGGRSRRGSTRSAAGARRTSRSGIPSAGSTFRNPPGDSAGAPDRRGRPKGHRVGGATVSEKHANFIVNDRKGTAADVRRLAGPGPRDRLGGRAASTSSREIVFLGDWDGLATWPPRARTPRSATTAYPPIVVLLGGPSAEHDVSIVSGTAIAEALAAGRPRRSARSSSTSTAAGGGCRPTTAARDGRPPPTTTRRRSGRRARSPWARRSTGCRDDPGAASCSSPSTARSARTARSRRCSRRPASPTPAPACRVRAGHGQGALQAARAAGSACPSSTGARSGRPAGEPDRAGVPRRARGVRGRRPATRG